MYRCKEASIKYDRYAEQWKVGAQHYFDYPQLADVFVHCWKGYSPATALKVKADLEGKLSLTVAKFVKDAAIAEAAGTVKDFLLGKLGAPSLPGPAGLAVKVLEAVGVVIGEAYLKEKIRMNQAFKNYQCDFSPEQNTKTYCNWVLYSWVIDAKNGPHYRTILPGSIH